MYKNQHVEQYTGTDVSLQNKVYGLLIINIKYMVFWLWIPGLNGILFNKMLLVVMNYKSPLFLIVKIHKKDILAWIACLEKISREP